MPRTITECVRPGVMAIPQWHRFPLVGADVQLAQFCDAQTASAWFARLRDEIAWEQHRLRIFGREVASPRLSSWVGDADAVYTYSGTRFVPHGWPPVLQPLRARLAGELAVDFNSVLANLYRDGRDAMGWHSDAERELGSAPTIASLSFGATRRFRLRPRDGGPAHDILELPHGSLLVMRGDTQRNYKHALPRTKKTAGERINLTFRRIYGK